MASSNTKLNVQAQMSYTHVFEPWSGNEGQPLQYSVCVMLDKIIDALAIKQVEAATNAAIQKGIPAKWNGKKPPILKLPLRDGDIERPNKPEFAGKMFFNAYNDEKPGLVNGKMQPITDTNQFYSGVIANVSVEFYPFTQRGIAVRLLNLQKVKDAPRLDGRTRPEDDFEILEDDDDDLLG